MNFILLLPILFPLLMGALVPVANKLGKHKRNIYILTCTVINSLMILYCILFLDSSNAISIFRLSGTMPIEVSLDGLGKVFSGLIAFLWPIATIYAFEYMEHEKKTKTFFAFYLMTYGITTGIAFAANLVTLYFFYEFLTLVTLPLVMFGMHEKNIKAGKKYVLYSMGGAAFAFLGMIVVYVFSGTTDFIYGGLFSTNIADEKILVIRIFYVFTVFGFGVKAAMFPFHGWLPTASVAPTPVTALLHAVAVVNAGVFAIIRATYYSFGTAILKGSYAQYILLTFSLITILYGSAMALKEQHFKRRLAYSTISNLSYMIFGIALMTPMGLGAAISHFVFHGIIKITLFFVAGAVLHMTGKSFVNDLFGFGKKMPVMFVCFTIASMGLVGVPPTIGFVSKWKLLTAAAGSASIPGYIGIGVLLISSVLTAMYLFSVVIKAYFPGEGFNKDSVIVDCDAGTRMKIAVIVCTVVSVFLIIFFNGLIDIFMKIASGVM